MRIFRVLFFPLLALLLSACGVDARIAKADKKFALGEYYRAAEMYRGAYRAIPTKRKTLRAEVAYKMGNAYRIVGNDKRADAAFRNAVRYKSKDTLLYYHYGEVLRREGKYEQALKMYEEYANRYPDSHLADNGIVSCRKAMEEWKKPKQYEVTKAAVLNSRYSEFCPAFPSEAGDVVYFNSTRVLKGEKKVPGSRITGQRNNSIYTARTNVQGKWENPVLLEGDINTTFDEGACAFSPNGQELYFTRCKVEKGETWGAAIFVSQRSGGAWSEPKPVVLVKDSSISCAHPALSPDGEYIYFSSDMPGGRGGTDLWRCKREEGGWSLPENLGSDINTPGEEVFPSFRPDGRLYFSSNGHQGLGGLDIYEAIAQPADTVTGELHWALRNLLQPINSRNDDFGICFMGLKEQGFFSSNRNDRKGYDHLYSFVVPETEWMLRGKVTDVNGNAVGGGVVKIVGSDGTIADVPIKKNGSYSFALNKNTDYLLLGTGRGFLNQKETLQVGDLEKSKEFTMDFQLKSISKPVQMNNIFFKFGSAELTPESTDGLNDLVKLLQDNPNITIEVGAHTDYIGTEEANKLLSTQRAQAVVDYLKSHGIDPGRLTAKGYGESQPVVPDKAMVKKYRFMEEDVPLDEEFIEYLNKEQQEIANSLNRRTEFKVMKTTYKML